MIDLSPCPPAGTGCHSWMMSAANTCRNRGITPAEAESMIVSRLNRPQTDPQEVAKTVRKVYGDASWTPRGNAGSFQRLNTPRRVPLTEIKHDPALSAAIASRGPSPRNWRHWLFERSAKLPCITSAAFIHHLYRKGEFVAVVVDKGKKRPALFARPTELFATPSTGPNGVFFLANPVDGEWHDTGTKYEDGSINFSCRNHQAVTDWRYFVLESDTLRGAEWLGIIAQLPLRISAIYTSGGKSIHVLCRIDAPDKNAWDTATAALKRPLRRLGGDSNMLSAVRLTRLPGCRRESKNGFQKLLYLNPDPVLTRLIEIPVILTRTWWLNHWCDISPRWADVRGRCL